LFGVAISPQKSLSGDGTEYSYLQSAFNYSYIHKLGNIGLQYIHIIAY